MALHPKIIKMLGDKASADLTTPYGATVLHHDIETATGEHIALNTVKRLTGILDGKTGHTVTILDIIARYLGFSSYKLLETHIADNTSDFNINDGFLDTSMLPHGAVLELEWEPDRFLKIIHEEIDNFTIEESRNSKLQKGDQIRIPHLKTGFPLYAASVVRNGKHLGTYQAAAIKGLTRLTYHES